MHETFGVYAQRTVQDTITALTNFFIFLPYFFSVENLLKTLFQPWKNITTKKSKPGFSFNEFGQRLADNFVSRFMGFAIRSALIFSYLIIQVFLVISVPGIFVVQVMLIPIRYAFYTSQPTPDQKKQKAKDEFMKSHLTEAVNQQYVEQWFELYYAGIVSGPWWSLGKLKSQPPLGRDLTSGFTPKLDQFSTELTKEKPHYHHLVGRKEELQRIQQVLSKSNQANVVLVGDEGVGKRTIVEALSKIIFDGSSDPALVYKRVLELNMEKILGSSPDFVKREEILGDLFKEASDARNVILFINNFDQYISEGDERINLSNIIQKYAQLDTLQFIGVTNSYLYQKYVFSNKAIASIFEKVDVNEVTKNQALTILLDVALDMEKKHNVKIAYEALTQTVVLTDRFITSIPLPEKAIALLDEACIYVKNHQEAHAVTAHIISIIIEQKTHVPTEVTPVMKDKLLTLEAELQKKIYHQMEAIQKLSAALRKSFVMVGSRNKPLASFLFLGPTGVGKTATAKAITEIFFGDIKSLIRFDMSLYQSKGDITKLVGSQESGEPGLLTEAIRKQQYGTLLLDELEKADKDLLNIFLTMLDEGYYTDGFGKKVDCNNLIIIATSNAGANFIYDFMQKKPDQIGDLSNQLIDNLVQEHIYSPEFLNRFDGVVVYKPLTKDAIVAIAHSKLTELKEKIQTQNGIAITFSEAFITNLIQQGYDPRFGARNMERIIRDQVEDKVAQIILQNPTPGQSITF